MRYMGLLSLLTIAGLAWPEGAGAATEPKSWGYLHAQCWQEQVSEPRNICEVGLDGEPSLAVIVSNIVRLDSKSFDPYARFKAELKRLHGLDMEPREAGPIASWEWAEAALVQAMRITRRVEKGKVAFLALSLEPERLADEPNAEEMEQMPPPLPDVTAAWQDEALTLWRTDTGCGLRDRDGKDILPALVTDPFGEAGESCPFQVASGYGLYAFHVPRNGAVCGEAGICTEIYGPDGNLMLVADYSPSLLTIHRDLHNIGLLVTGDRVQRLWSFPEQRYVSGPHPFLNVGPRDRIIVAGASIRHDRVAVVFEHHRARHDEPDYAQFFLDTRRFEEVALSNRRPLAKEATRLPPFARYERADIAACADDFTWVHSPATRDYLEQAFYEFDKHFRAIAAMLPRHIDAALNAPDDERAHRFNRLGLQLDALPRHLARLLPGVRGPADSAQIARLAGGFEFQSIDTPDRDAPRVDYLRAALAEEMIGTAQGEDRAHRTIDAFLTSLGKLRYAIRRAEAAIPHPETRAAEAMLLKDEAAELGRNWRDGFRPVAERAIFGDRPARLGDRLRPRVRAMCDWSGSNG